MSRFDHSEAKTRRARSLRSRLTACERMVWSRLRSAQIEAASFRRQHPTGAYVLDFFCPSLDLAVEIDGGQHSKAKHAAADRRRDASLRDRGIVTLRFWNSDVTENLDGVMETIRLAVLTQRELRATPSHPPPFRGRGAVSSPAPPAEASSNPSPSTARTPPPERGRMGGGQQATDASRPSRAASSTATPPPERGRLGGGQTKRRGSE